MGGGHIITSLIINSHFLCNQYLFFQLMEKEAKDESVYLKEVLNLQEEKQGFVHVDVWLGRKLLSDTMYVFSCLENTWIKT